MNRSFIILALLVTGLLVALGCTHPPTARIRGTITEAETGEAPGTEEVDAAWDLVTPRDLSFALAPAAGGSSQPTVEQRGKVKGIIRDNRTGAPLWGASVLIVGTQFGVVADSLGQYELRGVVPGTYDFRFAAVGYKSTVAASVSVVHDSTTNLDAELVQYPGNLDKSEGWIVRSYVPPAGMGLLRGAVLDQETRNPIPSATVSVLGVDLKTTTNELGDFAVTAIPPGIYSVRFFHSRYEPYEQNDVRIIADSVTIFSPPMKWIPRPPSEPTPDPK